MSDLVPIGKETLAPAQFAQLANAPPELEWLANIAEPKRTTSQGDTQEFSMFTELHAPTELRTVTRAHAIA